MKNFEAWEACRAGRIDREAAGSNVIMLDMNALRIRNGNEVLIRDLIRELQRMLGEFESTHETGSPWVPVMDLPTNSLTFRTVLALPRVANQMSKNLGGNSEPEVTVEPQAGDAPGGCLPKPPNVHAADPVHVDLMPTDNQPHEHQQPGLDLSEPVDANARDQANLLALQTLSAYYGNEIATLDEIDERIQLSPLPDVTRCAIFAATPKWAPISTASGVLSWPANGGIQHKLPLSAAVGLVVSIHSLDDLFGRKYTARLRVIKIPKLSHFSLIHECARMEDSTLFVEVLTADIFARLSFARSLNLPVNIAVSVEKCVNQGSRASLTVIQAFCPPQDYFDPEKTNRLTEELFNQPEEMELWEPEGY
jgi:hypothetical protein